MLNDSTLQFIQKIEDASPIDPNHYLKVQFNEVIHNFTDIVENMNHDVAISAMKLSPQNNQSPVNLINVQD